MPQKRITLSLNDEISGDKSILDFLSGLPRRTRSEIIKEILLDALEKRDEHAEPEAPTPNVVCAPADIDPEEIIEKLF
jgi:hypothetical protein